MVRVEPQWVLGDCVLALPMTEGVGVPVEISGRYTISLNNTNWFGTGKYGSATMQFVDGRNDGVIVSEVPQIKLTNALTFMAWVKPSSFEVGQGAPRILDKGISLDYAWYFVGGGANVLRFLLKMGGISYTRDSAQIPQFIDGKWHHVALTWEGISGVVNHYIDGGVSGAPAAKTGTLDTTASDLVIGNRDGFDRDFDGYICEVYIFNNVLSASIIATIARGARVVP